ncbi:DinB family protein [Algoriphagus machipongonensis]|uniref:DinB-like domain-containing protein n=1 Tax=Algoriphagus machipongonensis TaxID=388413 RepID=A3HWJ3_9BACT|nr:DinB family protein [Algoriphagus machipongonensis]EAZ80966.1 hypothetical protein ALPR1_18058 [Algoriphagus machipongonensis]
MKTLFSFAIIFLAGVIPTFSQTTNDFLVKQLEYSHSSENWFAPINVATEGINATQANWHDESENHSIAQLVSHLVFWNDRLLQAIKGNPAPQFEGDNEETFSEISEDEWTNMVEKLDQIMNEIEVETKKLEGKQLEGWSETLANIAAHNAYHTGQIVYIRKQNNWWR